MHPKVMTLYFKGFIQHQVSRTPSSLLLVTMSCAFARKQGPAILPRWQRLLRGGMQWGLGVDYIVTSGGSLRARWVMTRLAPWRLPLRAIASGS